MLQISRHEFVLGFVCFCCFFYSFCNCCWTEAYWHIKFYGFFYGLWVSCIILTCLIKGHQQGKVKPSNKIIVLSISCLIGSLLHGGIVIFDVSLMLFRNGLAKRSNKCPACSFARWKNGNDSVIHSDTQFSFILMQDTLDLGATVNDDDASISVLQKRALHRKCLWSNKALTF